MRDLVQSINEPKVLEEVGGVVASSLDLLKRRRRRQWWRARSKTDRTADVALIDGHDAGDYQFEPRPRRSASTRRLKAATTPGRTACWLDAPVGAGAS